MPPEPARRSAIVTLAALDPGAPEYFWQNVLGLPTSGRTVTVDNVDGAPGRPATQRARVRPTLTSSSRAAWPRRQRHRLPGTQHGLGFADAFFQAASQNIASSVSASWGSRRRPPASVASGRRRPPTRQRSTRRSWRWPYRAVRLHRRRGLGGLHGHADLGTTNLSVDASADSPFITAAGGTTLPWTGTLDRVGTTSASRVPPADLGLGLPVAARRQHHRHPRWPRSAETPGRRQRRRLQHHRADPVVPAGRARHARFERGPVPDPDRLPAIDGLVLPTAWNFNPTPSVIARLRVRAGLSPTSRPTLTPRPVPPVRTLERQRQPATARSPGWLGRHQLRGPPAQRVHGGHRLLPRAPGRFLEPRHLLVRHRAELAVHSRSTQSGTGSDNIYYTGTPGRPSTKVAVSAIPT